MDFNEFKKEKLYHIENSSVKELRDELEKSLESPEIFSKDATLIHHLLQHAAQCQHSHQMCRRQIHL